MLDDPRNAAEPEAEWLTDFPVRRAYHEEQIHFIGNLFDADQKVAALRSLKILVSQVEGAAPLPPFGLPGERAMPKPEAMALLQLGYDYFRSAVAREPRRQWNLHKEAQQMLRQSYQAGRQSVLDTIDAEARARAAVEDARYTERVDTSLVYFIGSEDGPVKIGMAIDVEKRIKGLQTSHHAKLALLATTTGGREQEAAYHRQFAASRLHGEWFERTPELLAEIERLSA
jgi:hypothetical protein